jgi:RimJ/RimL family protein N-acetyltransferase
VEFRPSYPIRTARLALRPYEASDLDAVLEFESREDVVRYLRWGPMDRQAAAELIERRVGQTWIGPNAAAIVVAASIPPEDRVIGEFMLRLTDEASRQGEIGWTLHPAVQGHGYATEGALEMLRLGFDELGLHRITAEADPRNRPSLRLMERLGMRPEAEFRDVELVKGEWVGAAVHAIMEDEWRGIRSSERRAT